MRIIGELPPPVHVVTFVGDARCGKSSLASAVSGDPGTFKAGGGTEPVTAGIDTAVVKMPSGGNLVILDCEGCNSPSAPAGAAVDVLSMLCSTLVVQVVWGQLGEHQLQQLGASLATRDVMPTLENGESLQLPDQRLMIVVNADHLGHSSSDLEKALRNSQKGMQARNELRSRIREFYLSSQLVSIPYVKEMGSTSLATGAPLRAAILEASAPVTMGGMPVSGLHINEMAQIVIKKLGCREPISFPSIYRYIVFDQHLQPMVERLLSQFRSQLPLLEDYNPDLCTHYDKRMEKLQSFDKETHQISSGEMVREAREKLQQELNNSWEDMVALNAAFGKQVKYQTAQFDQVWKCTEEQVVGFSRCLILGPKRPVYGTVKIYEEVTRLHSFLKDGTEEDTPWKPTGRTFEVHPQSGRTSNPQNAVFYSGNDWDQQSNRSAGPHPQSMESAPFLSATSQFGTSDLFAPSFGRERRESGSSPKASPRGVSPSPKTSLVSPSPKTSFFGTGPSFTSNN